MYVSVSSTAIFTILAVFLTITLAYPLSRKYLPHHNAMMFFVTFTMMFNGGIIPTYMMVRALRLTNTFWALIFPAVISAYNTLILVTAFRAIPDDFEEAALVEGAGHLRILFTIMLPLCKPTIAVLVLYYAVSRWNNWFDAVMYVNDMELYTLPIVIRKVLLQGKDALSYSLTAPPPTLSIQSAAVIFSVLPILALYPFLQKYFVKGVMIGGIKG
jgi:ABC-type glycerol-3-phosphate transport system permease component